MNLTLSLNEWSNRPELATFHDTFIELTESALNSRLHERHLETFATYGIAPGTNYITLLTSVTEVLGATFAGKKVEFTSRDEVLSARERGGSKVVAAVVGRTIELAGAVTQIEVRQKVKIATLIGGGTNWVFETFPHVYLFGCLVELFDHLRDQSQTAHYKTRFEEALAHVNATMLGKSSNQFATARGVR